MSSGVLGIDVGMDISDAGSQLNKLGDGLEGLERKLGRAEKSGGGFVGGLVGGLGKLGGMLNPVGLLASGIGVLGSKLTEAGQAAIDEAPGIERFNRTIQNSAKDWDGNVEALDRYINKQENLAFGDDKLRDSLAYLVDSTKSLTEAQELQSVAMDLARHKKLDLEAASKLVGKADAGNIAVLKKLGIEVEEGMQKEEILAAIRKASAGQAEAYANTAAGSMARIQSVMGNAVEDIGGVLLPKVTQAFSFVADMLSGPGFQDGLRGAVDLIGNGIGGALNIIGGVIDTVGPPVRAFFGLIGEAVQGATSLSEVLWNLGDSFGGISGPLGNIYQSFVWIVEGIEKFIGAIQGGQDPLQAFGDLLGTVWLNVKFALENALQWIGTEGLPLLVSKLGEWGGAFLGWIGPMIPPFLQQLGEWGKAILDWLISTAIPNTITTLMTLGRAFVDWIGPQLPGWLAEAGKFLAGMLSWVFGDALPALIGKLAEWAGAFIQWIADNDVISKLLSGLWTLLVAVGKWLITDALPNIAKKLAEWAEAFVRWVIDNDVIGKLLRGLGELLIGIGKWLLFEALPNIVRQLAEWAQAFFDWVAREDVILKLLLELGKMSIAMQKWFLEEALPGIVSALKEWGGALIDWVARDANPFIGAKLKEFGDKVLSWISQAAQDVMTKAKEIGLGIINGITQGIRNSWGSIMATVTQLAEDLPQPIKDALGIKSPSTVFAELGGYMMEGLVVGWNDAMGNIYNAISGTMEFLAMLTRGYMDPRNELSIAYAWSTGLNDMFGKALLWRAKLEYEIFRPALAGWTALVSNEGQSMATAWSTAMDAMATASERMAARTNAAFATLPSGAGGGGSGGGPGAGTGPTAGTQSASMARGGGVVVNVNINGVSGDRAGVERAAEIGVVRGLRALGMA